MSRRPVHQIDRDTGARAAIAAGPSDVAASGTSADRGHLMATGITSGLGPPLGRMASGAIVLGIGFAIGQRSVITEQDGAEVRRS